ncbi:MAG: hypothetical protein GXY36_08675 [Chloroflexi bacterium]|nr:hypothetical protein [Chloroflexota bacterium]
MSRSTSTYSPPKRKKRMKATLPLVGLLFAVLLGVVAYFLAPPLVELLEGQFPDIEQQFDNLRADIGETPFNALIAGLLWLVMLALSVFLVAALIGEDPEKEAWKYMGPHPKDIKGMKRERKRLQKEAQKRARQRKAMEKKKKTQA